jgi:hypothetical protein
MKASTRRSFLRQAALAAPASAMPAAWAGGPRRRGGLVFVPTPHPQMPPLTFAFASDTNGDPFATVPVTDAGITVAEPPGEEPFSVSAQWYVEGFGFVWLEADNAGEYYDRSDIEAGRTLVLAHEFARTRVSRNEDRLARYRAEGCLFSAEVRHLHALAAELAEDAASRDDPERTARLADRALLYALLAGEKIELEKATFDIARRGRRDGFHFGCETRQFIWAKSGPIPDLFADLFNYATVTHYVWDSWYEHFEPEPGKHRWGIKDNIVDWLTERGVTIEGRPLFWFHPAVTPDWLREMDYDRLRRYVADHTRALVGHYGDRVSHWEVVNEYHDWANVHDHTPDQITEITRLACEETHAVNPGIDRIINNCCPFAHYASYGRDADGPADRRLRTPRRFVADLVDAGVPFETVGVQVYFPRRDLADIVRLLERFAGFGKPVFITEVGASSGVDLVSLVKGEQDLPGAPYEWHRSWDPDLQADWLEQAYTLFYSKPFIKGISWYDFSDFRPFIRNGGLVTEESEPKLSYTRLKSLLGRWDQLPID